VCVHRKSETQLIIVCVCVPSKGGGGTQLISVCVCVCAYRKSETQLLIVCVWIGKVRLS